MTEVRRASRDAGIGMIEVLLVTVIVVAVCVLVIRLKNIKRPDTTYRNFANARQLALAALMYAGGCDDALPLTVNGQLSRLQNRRPGQLTFNCPGPGTQEAPDPRAAGGEPALGWPGEIAPYVKSRGLYVDPSRGDVLHIWDHDPLFPGDPNYDPEGATVRNQNLFPMYGYNYMFLSPLRIPKAMQGIPDAMNYAVADSHKTDEAGDPTNTVLFAASQANLSNPSRGFFVINAPGMWPTFAKGANGLIGFWGGTPGTGDWVGTATACADASSPCPKPLRSYGFTYMIDGQNPSAEVAFLDGHMKYVHATDLAAGTNFLTAIAGSAASPGSGSVIVDKKHYIWDLK